jgi:serine/threonine protein kinase
MKTGTWPFDNRANSQDKLYRHIVAKDYPKFWQEWAQTEDASRAKARDLTDEFKNLIVKLLAYDFTDRPSIEEIKEHAWFKGSLPT